MPAWAALPRQEAPRPPALGLKYGKGPKQLGFFLAQMWNYIQEYGADLATKAVWIRCVTTALDGTAAEWFPYTMKMLQNSGTSTDS